MTQETLKKAVELNKKFEQLAEISKILGANRNTKMTLCIGDYIKHEIVQEYDLAGALRKALEKAIEEMFNDIKKEIEEL